MARVLSETIVEAMEPKRLSQLDLTPTLSLFQTAPKAMEASRLCSKKVCVKQLAFSLKSKITIVLNYATILMIISFTTDFLILINPFVTAYNFSWLRINVDHDNLFSGLFEKL